MEPNPQVTEAILEIVENQLRAGDPEETKTTYERLVGLGYSESEARKLLGCVVLTELNEVTRQQKPFNQKRFSRLLCELPKLPWE